MTVVGLIGSGNMARALAMGWRRSGSPPEKLLLADVDQNRAAQLAVEVSGTAVSSREVVEQADLVLLAVKPQNLVELAQEIAGPLAEKKPLVCSILAGVATSRLEEELGDELEIIRFMPNTPVEVGRGTLCYCLGSNVEEATVQRARELFAPLGQLIEVPEAEMNVITALVGSSPAFFAFVVEAVVDAGVEQGLNRDLAAKMTTATFAGTGELILERAGDARSVREQVTSPGGTTEAGLKALKDADVAAAYGKAIAAAVERCRQLI